MQEIYELKHGIIKAEEKIKDLLKVKDGTIVVLVAGGSASGKTSQVAKKLFETYKDNSILLSMDNYYRGREYYEKYNLNFDQPEALNLDLFFEHLSILKNGNSVKIPEYDFVNSCPIFDKIEVNPKKIIIIEGLFTLYDKIATLGDLKIFVDLGTHGRILRRVFRDVKRTGQKPKEILEYFLDTVEKMNDKYIEPTKKEADFIISNEYNPFLEASDTKIKDSQIKYDISLFDEEKISDILLKNGAQFLGDLEYNDYYFSPKYFGKEISWDDEILLIRKISFDKYVLIYKGPLEKSKDFEERFVINFFVDGEVVGQFREIYGDDMKIISRKRTTFFYKGNLIFIDIFENDGKTLEIKFENYDEFTKTNLKNILSDLCSIKSDKCDLI